MEGEKISERGWKHLLRRRFRIYYRRAQECIELSVKSVLRAVGVEFPREHDVSDVFLG
jgi:HEPN domain-containing protein